MSRFLTIFFIFLGACALNGLASTPAFAATEKAAKEKKAVKIDINKATKEQLQELPGIGETYATKIINGRPYQTEADLVNVGIPQKVVDKIKDSIKFGKVKAEKATEATKTKAKATETTKTKAAAPKEKTTETTKTTTKVKKESNKAVPHTGMVWVNTRTKVYHREGDRWYGNTEQGEYMTEKDAIKYGARLSEQN